MDPLRIRLSPHDALLIASFIQEYRGEMEGEPKFESLIKAHEEFIKQVAIAMPEGGIDDAWAEIEVNILLGKSPDSRKA